MSIIDTNQVAASPNVAIAVNTSTPAVNTSESQFAEAMRTAQPNGSTKTSVQVLLSKSEPVAPTSMSALDYTFASGSDPNPPYIKTDQNVTSDGQKAAYKELKREKSESRWEEAANVEKTIHDHKNDPEFLRDYFNTLGSGRVAKMYNFLTCPGGHTISVGHQAGPWAEHVQEHFQDLADALSTLQKNNLFHDGDMNEFVKQFVDVGDVGSLDHSYFAKDLLGKASPEINRMFYQSAKKYALNDNNPADKRQSMAADAMQALSQTDNSYAMQELSRLNNDPHKPEAFNELISAAMKGEAAHGNMPTVEQGAYHSPSEIPKGQGDLMTGLSNLMFNAAFAGTDTFSAGGNTRTSCLISNVPAPLSPRDAGSLQAHLFQVAMDTIQNDPTVKSFYTENVPDPTKNVSMKDALAVDFQEGYDSIVKHYSSANGEFSNSGELAFREFFADVVFTPPASNRAFGAVKTLLDKLNTFTSQANSANAKTMNGFAARSLGEQLQAMNSGLSLALGRIKDGKANADQNTKNLLTNIIAIGGGVASAAGPEATAGAALVVGALNLLIASGGSDRTVQGAKDELKKKGIDVSGCGNDDLTDSFKLIKDERLSGEIEDGWDHTHDFFDQHDHQR